MKVVRSVITLGILVLIVICGIEAKSTMASAVLLFSLDELLSRSEQENVINKCTEYIHRRGVSSLQEAKALFNSLATLAVRKEASNALLVRAMAVIPLLCINNAYVLAQGPILVPCAVYDSHIVHTLPHITVDQKELQRSTLPRDIEKFMHGNGRALVCLFDVTWISPTKIIACDREKCDFKIVLGQETVPSSEHITMCREIYAQLKPKAHSCLCADVRFDNQIIAFYEKQDGIHCDIQHDMIMKKGVG